MYLAAYMMHAHGPGARARSIIFKLNLHGGFKTLKVRTSR